MLVRPLPRSPDLKLINDHAKNLLWDFCQGNALALMRHFSFDSMPDTFNPRLAEAQHMIARKYRYMSWPKLEQHAAAPYDRRFLH